MRSVIAAIAVTVALVSPCLDRTLRAFAAQSTSAGDVVFYRVPLMCPAARGLGCGSAAKPVLLDLEKRPLVEEAWLNKTGETLAVVWKEGSEQAERRSVIGALADATGISMDELNARAREAALKAFRSGTGWHRGAEVDRLSEQEARVISGRLLRRAATQAPTVQDKRKVVGPALTEAIRRQLVSACTSPQECRDALLAAARPHLDPSELTALGEAIARGFTPVGDEQ